MPILFVRSLVLASTLSFVVPILAIGSLWIALTGVAHLPVIEAIGQMGAQLVVHVLSVFGSGSPLQGTLTIGLTCGLVGAMFDTYAFYRHHHFSS